MANIGIMGGTFDPPHFAHLLLAERAYEQYNLDYVIFMAGGNPPHKKENDLTDAAVRNQMLKAAIYDNPHFKLSEYEIRKQEYSYTADTLEYLKEKNPNDKLFFIMGEDSLAYLDKWYRPDKIVQCATILAYPRGIKTNLHYQVQRIKKVLDADIKIIDAPILEISSSKIRELVGEKKSIKYLLPETVIEIIEKEQLYGRRTEKKA